MYPWHGWRFRQSKTWSSNYIDISIDLSYFFMFCFFVTRHSLVSAFVVGYKSDLGGFARLHLRKNDNSDYQPGQSTV